MVLCAQPRMVSESQALLCVSTYWSTKPSFLIRLQSGKLYLNNHGLLCNLPCISSFSSSLRIVERLAKVFSASSWMLTLPFVLTRNKISSLLVPFRKLSFMKTNSEINGNLGHEKITQVKMSVFSTAALL